MKYPYVLIMAGGSGTRLWPLSRKKKPKQLLRLFSKKTLIQETLDRAMFITKKKRIFIATTPKLKKEIRKNSPYLKEKQFIVEPEARNTAPVISLFCAILKAQKKDVTNPIVVLASDHFISPAADWVNVVESTFPFLKQSIFCIGVKPTRPDTSYGYIQAGKSLENGLKAQYEVISFKEKPSLSTAKKYIKKDHFLWNSGMFIFSAETFLRELSVHSPEIYNLSIQCAQSRSALKTYFTKMPNISIDYALMEKTSTLSVVKGSFRWDDIGSFLSFERTQEKTSQDNIISDQSDMRSVDARGNIILTNSKKLKVALLGIKDLIVVEKEGVLLIAQKEKIGQIEALRKKFTDEL